jgi:hypothetical protein
MRRRREDFHERRVDVDERFDDLIPGYAMAVTTVGFDRFAIRINYEITPPTAPSEDVVRWEATATDDAGNSYEEAGGAFGKPLGRDDVIDGVRSLQPLPARGVRYLDIAFAQSPGAAARHVIRVAVPPDSLSAV